MKFENNVFLKHKDCMDAFIYIQSCIMDTGGKAIINAEWMVQGTIDHWWTGEYHRILIKADQYDNWLPYKSKGRLL